MNRAYNILKEWVETNGNSSYIEFSESWLLGLFGTRPYEFELNQSELLEDIGAILKYAEIGLKSEKE